MTAIDRCHSMLPTLTANVTDADIDDYCRCELYSIDSNLRMFQIKSNS